MSRLLRLGAAGAGAEYGEEDRQEEQAVKEAEGDDEEDHLEEGDEDVGGSNHQSDHAEDGGDGALQDGQPQSVQAVPHSVVRSPLAVQVVVRDVGGEVDRKPGEKHQQSNSASGNKSAVLTQYT